LDLYGSRYINKGANLDGTNFKNARMIGANFSGADLRNANFENADLKHAKFTDAIINDNNFSGANLEKAKFCNTKRYGTSFIFFDYQKVDDTGCSISMSAPEKKYKSNFLDWVKKRGNFE